jgi:ketosteroid isomerase-like protein
MRTALTCLALCGALLAACSSAPTAPAKPVDRAALERQVGDTERAFAKTMADRDLAAFNSFLSEETVFFSGPTPLRGKAAVTDFWKRFYEKPAAPFSWRPDKVEALDSGTLALSTGPVFDPAGKCIGRFTSIWRQEAPGVWKIIFDKGGPCEE